MTKIVSLLCALLLFILNCDAQPKRYFEGTIHYAITIIPKINNLDTAKLRDLLGKSSTLSFKEGNYRHVYEGGTIEFDFYSVRDNKLYSKKHNNDTLYWVDCGAIGSKIQKLHFATKRENILGISCNQLKIQYQDKIQTDYYNPDSLATNPKWFKRFTLNGENLIDEKEKSIYLKSEIENPYLIYIQTAIKIIRQPIDDNLFKVSPNAILVKLEE